MLEGDDKVESLNFKSKLDEGLGDFVKENLRNNKNRVKEVLTTNFTRSYLVGHSDKCSLLYKYLIFSLWSHVGDLVYIYIGDPRCQKRLLHSSMTVPAP